MAGNMWCGLSLTLDMNERARHGEFLKFYSYTYIGNTGRAVRQGNLGHNVLRMREGRKTTDGVKDSNGYMPISQNWHLTNFSKLIFQH